MSFRCQRCGKQFESNVTQPCHKSFCSEHCYKIWQLKEAGYSEADYFSELEAERWHAAVFATTEKRNG